MLKFSAAPISRIKLISSVRPTQPIKNDMRRLTFLRLLSQARFGQNLLTCGVLVSSLLASSACSSSSDTTSDDPPTTALSVDMTRWQQDLRCNLSDGAWKTSVTTIQDLDAPTGSPDAPSSPITPCQYDPIFESIIDGHRYSALIEAYDRDDIEPLAVGSRYMVVSGTQDIVPVRWVSSCGALRNTHGYSQLPQASENYVITEAGIIGYLNRVIDFQNCIEMSEVTPSTYPTGVVVTPSAVLSGFRCKSAGGGVSEYTATLGSGTLPPATFSCGSEVSFEGLPTNILETIEISYSLSNTDAGVPSTWKVNCSARTISNIMVISTCGQPQPA